MNEPHLESGKRTNIRYGVVVPCTVHDVHDVQRVLLFYLTPVRCYAIVVGVCQILGGSTVRVLIFFSTCIWFLDGLMSMVTFLR